MHGLFRPRHLAATAMVFLLTATAAVGLATAGEEPDAETPPLRIGDRIEYETEDGHRYRFEVLGVEPFHNGTHLMTAIVVRWTNPETGFTRDHYLEATTGQVVGMREGGDEVRFQEGPVPGVGEVQETRRGQIEYMQWGPGICGFLHPWQGQPWSDRAMAWQCGYSADAEWSLLRGGARPQVQFEQDFGPGRGEWTWQMVYDRDIPYPLVVAEMEDGRAFRIPWRLVGFQAGDGELPAAEPPRPLDLPDIRQVPLTPWTLDERGTDMPFPIAAAHEAALADAEAGAWLDEHPDAYLTHGSLLDNDGDVAHQRWYLEFSDTRDRMVVRVEREVETVLSRLGSPYQVNVVQQDDEGTTRPARDQVAELPSLASMAAVWEALAEAPVKEFGFSLRCHAGCQGYEAHLWVGRADSSTGEEPLSQHSLRRTVSFDETGSLTGAFFVQSDSRPSTEAPPAAPVASLQAIEPPAFSPMQLAGALTFLATLLYFLHPLVKSGVGALFSRIRRDEALDHPARSRVMDIIEARPGIHYGALREQSGLSNGACQHHVRRLLDTGHIVAAGAGRRRCYFVKGAHDRRDMLGLAALQHPGARRVFEAVGGGRGTSAVAATAGLAPSTAHHHLVRLREAGLVTKDGRVWRRHP